MKQTQRQMKNLKVLSRQCIHKCNDEIWNERNFKLKTSWNNIMKQT